MIKKFHDLMIISGLVLGIICGVMLMNCIGQNCGLPGLLPIFGGILAMILFVGGLIIRAISRVKSKEFGSSSDYWSVALIILGLMSPLIVYFCTAVLPGIMLDRHNAEMKKEEQRIINSLLSCKDLDILLDGKDVSADKPFFDAMLTNTEVVDDLRRLDLGDCQKIREIGFVSQKVDLSSDSSKDIILVTFQSVVDVKGELYEFSDDNRWARYLLERTGGTYQRIGSVIDDGDLIISSETFGTQYRSFQVLDKESLWKGKIEYRWNGVRYSSDY